jgi:hypothetical protein
MALNIALFCSQSQITMLASGPTAWMIDPVNGDHNAFVVTMGSLPPMNYTGTVANWIWGSACNNCIRCVINNTFVQNFTMLCPGASHTLYIQAATKYTFEILGQTGAAQNKTVIQNYTITTQPGTCGQTINLNVNASSIGPCTSANYAGLRYTIVAPDCTKGCAANSFYDPSVCSCQLCTKYLSKCAACTSSTSCTLCANNTLALVNGKCQACSVTLPKCKTCQSSTLCLTCLNGSKPNATTGKCP